MTFLSRHLIHDCCALELALSADSSDELFAALLLILWTRTGGDRESQRRDIACDQRQCQRRGGSLRNGPESQWRTQAGRGCSSRKYQFKVVRPWENPNKELPVDLCRFEDLGCDPNVLVSSLFVSSLARWSGPCFRDGSAHIQPWNGQRSAVRSIQLQESHEMLDTRASKMSRPALIQ